MDKRVQVLKGKDPANDGTGKTHTMEGPSLWDTSTQGVIPRAIDKLFQSISEADIHTAFTVSVSYYEVIIDLVFPIRIKILGRFIARKFVTFSTPVLTISK